MIIHDNLDKPSSIKAEHCNVRCLDGNNIMIIGTVMAQSVALDYYAATVEEKLDSFMEMNRYIEENNSFDLVVSQQPLSRRSTDSPVRSPCISYRTVYLLHS